MKTGRKEENASVVTERLRSVTACTYTFSMARIALPLLPLKVPEQRYSCHGCGDCCRDFTVQLRPEDLRKLQEQQWSTRLGEPVTTSFRGAEYLRQRADGACIFLLDGGRCRIHQEFGFEAKPIACQLFPFHITPAASGLRMGVNFACQSVLENKGAELPAHARDLRRMAGEISELRSAAPPPKLTNRIRAAAREEETLIEHFDSWLRRTEVHVRTRLDGMAWVVQSLASARLERVRDERLRDLLDVLFGALPEELAHLPLAPSTSRQRKMLRQAVFTRVEDLKILAVAPLGRFRTSLRQFFRSRRFKSGRGMTPAFSSRWPQTDLQRVEDVAPARDPADMAAIDDLITRYLRACILSGRMWGAGYYGWSIVDGLQALVLNVACIGWLARLHAAGAGRSVLTIGDVRAAVGRVDRTSGRAPWLGSSAERLRLRFLAVDDGLRRLALDYALLEAPSGIPQTPAAS